jgi:PilZ domain
VPSPKAEEKRKAPRYPLERLAKILPGRSNPPRYCLTTDISNGGVRVNAFGFAIPDEFVLLLSGDGPARDGTYRVIWRLGRDVGAKFIGRETP